MVIILIPLSYLNWQQGSANVIKKLRRKVGQWLIGKGIKLAGVPLKPTTEVKQALDQPLDAIVESETTDNVQWSPEQHGNVIAVEPMMIAKHRRGKLWISAKFAIGYWRLKRALLIAIITNISATIVTLR